MEYQPLTYIYRPAGNKLPSDNDRPSGNSQPSGNNPPSAGAAAYTLLLLHGTGGDETDMFPLAKEFGTGFNILSLRGNVSEGGMPRFFRRLGMGVFDEPDLVFRTHEMVTFIKALAVKEDFDITKVIAVGYSNGANIAGSTLVLYPDFLAGAILYRPMQPFKHIDADKKSGRHTPVFMSNGSMDPTIQPLATKMYAEILRSANFYVSDYSLPAGHNLTQQDLRLSVEWFAQNFPAVQRVS
jgi:phospholipase/carboxylesterase